MSTTCVIIEMTSADLMTLDSILEIPENISKIVTNLSTPNFASFFFELTHQQGQIWGKL